MTPDQALQTLASESQECGDYDGNERNCFEKWSGKNVSNDMDIKTENAWEDWLVAYAAGRASAFINFNFCPHCGKRNSADLIHTCTPPENE